MTKCSLILSIKNCFKNPRLEIKLQIKKKLLINTVDLKHEVLSAFTEHNTSREQYNPKIKISLAKRGSFLLVSCDSFFFFPICVRGCSVLCSYYFYSYCSAFL